MFLANFHVNLPNSESKNHKVWSDKAKGSLKTHEPRAHLEEDAKWNLYEKVFTIF